MSIRKLRAGRVPTVTQAQYVGEKGTIFWNELTGEFRLSDGTTPGGSRVGFPIASTTEIGGIKLGPGTLLNNDGQLIIDSTGLDFSFGDFVATTPADTSATLMSRNTNQNIDIVSNGTGAINIIGDFHVHRTVDYDPNTPEANGAIFSVNEDGLTKIHTPTPPIGDSVLSISSNSSATIIPLAAGAVGAVLQLVGANDASTTVGMDTFANNATASSNFTFRRYRGTVDTPLAVQAGDLMAALGATAFDGTGTATLPGQVTSIRYVAAENQTLTAKGSRIDMYAIPLGTISRTLNLSLDGVKVSVPLDTQSISTTTGALVTAGGLGVVKDVYVGGTIHGALTGNVTGNADTVTNGVVTTGSYSDPSWLTISKSKVGLSNVDNTADANKNVLYATTAGGAPATDVYAWAKAATKPSYTKSEVGLSAVENTALSTWAGSSNITTVGTLGSLSVTNTVTAGLFDGKTKRTVRDAGTIADGGTVTINFLTDDVVLFVWANGVTLAYSNYTAGRIVKVLAKKATGSGTDQLSLGGLTGGNTSSGGTTIAGNADQTYFIDLHCTNTSIGSVYAKF